MVTATADITSASRTSLLPRRVGAVLAGLFSIFAVTSLVDGVLHATGVFPPVDAPPMSDGLFLLAFAYRALFGVAGSWVTARLAPVRPIFHAIVLGGIGTALSIAGAIAMWGLGPGWYSIAVAASTLPCAYLGGRLGARR